MMLDLNREMSTAERLVFMFLLTLWVCDMVMRVSRDSRLVVLTALSMAMGIVVGVALESWRKRRVSAN